MRGHIRQRGRRSWAVVIDIGRDPITGKRHQKWHSVKGTKRDAQRELARLLYEVNVGTYVEPAKLTVAQYLERWLHDYAWPNTSPRTHQGYEINIRRHVVPTLGSLPLPRLQPAQIQALYSSLLDQGLAPRTVLYVHRTLHQALKHALQWQLIARNPADAVQAPKVKSREIRVLDVAEVRRLLGAIDDPLLKVVVELAVTTGMRRGEILGLRWADVDLEAQRAHVTQALSRDPRGPAFRQPKTHRSLRPVSLPRSMAEGLRRWRSQQEEYQEVLGAAYQDYGLVCARPDGRPADPDWVTKAFSRLLRKLDLPPVGLHGLRHAHATWLLQQGIHPKVVQERLGHGQISITLDTYSHVMPSLQDEAAARVDELLNPKS